jgi:hypothetical protein
MIRQDVIRQIVSRDQQKMALSENAVQQHDPRLFEAACETFGTWETALRYAGVRQSRRKRAILYSPERVIAAIRFLCIKGYNLAAGRNARRNWALYRSAVPHFGTWRNAIQASGINLQHAFITSRMDERQIIATIRERHGLGLPLARKQTFLQHRALVVAAISKFGRWNNAVAAAGLEPVSHGQPPKLPT